MKLLIKMPTEISIKDCIRILLFILVIYVCIFGGLKRLSLILFIITILISPLKYFRIIIKKYVPGDIPYKKTILRYLKTINPLMRRIHILISPFAFLSITIHSLREWSNCNIYLRTGLIILIVYMITGFGVTYVKMPSKTKKILLKMHRNVLLICFTILIFYLGH